MICMASTRRCDINRLSTRSAPGWSAETHTPRLPRVLIAALVSLSAICLWQVALTEYIPTPGLLVIAALLIAQTVVSWRRTGRCLKIQDDDGTWTFTSLVDDTSRTGSLVQARYRSSWLLVLKFEAHDGTRFTEEFWRDALSAPTFSRLHYAALYGVVSATSEQTLPGKLTKHRATRLVRYTRCPPVAAGQPQATETRDTSWRECRPRSHRTRRTWWPLP